MAKNNEDRNVTPDTASAQPGTQNAPSEQKTATRAQIWTFWLAVATAVIAARALDYALPGLPEHVTERWVMAAFAAFLGVFLFKLK